MRKYAIGVGVLLFVIVGGALYHWSDVGLLSDETCLKIVSSDVLGNLLYGPSCPRSLYAERVESPHGSNKGEAAIFKFRALPDNEDQCPPISVIVDRRSGEAWILK